MEMSAKSLAGFGAAAAIAAAAGYPLLWRHACLTWGASAIEVCREMPGDALLPGARLVSTRAVTVDAWPSAVWPWLVQMGPGRGGAYTYDWIENLFGLNMHSADRIRPELQHLVVGDVLPLGPKGPGMRVEILGPERVLAFRSTAGDWVWIFQLTA